MRVLGDVTEGDALDVLRHVDEVYVQTIRDYGLYDKIWQAFAVFLPVRCNTSLSFALLLLPFTSAFPCIHLHYTSPLLSSCTAFNMHANASHV